jgi:Mg2+/citrate symporter
MKEFINRIVWIIVVVLALTFYKVTFSIIGIIVLFLMLAFINGRKEEKRLKKFRKKNNGKYYLWYSSNKRLKEYVEGKLKPMLGEFEIIYNNRERIESELTMEELRHLRNVSGSIKFPIVFKVGINRIYAESFFEEINEYKHSGIQAEFEKKIILKLNKLKNE